MQNMLEIMINGILYSNVICHCYIIVLHNTDIYCCYLTELYNMKSKRINNLCLSFNPPQQALDSASINRNYDKKHVEQQCYITRLYISVQRGVILIYYCYITVSYNMVTLLNKPQLQPAAIETMIYYMLHSNAIQHFYVTVLTLSHNSVI